MLLVVMTCSDLQAMPSCLTHVHTSYFYHMHIVSVPSVHNLLIILYMCLAYLGILRFVRVLCNSLADMIISRMSDT